MGASFEGLITSTSDLSMSFPWRGLLKKPPISMLASPSPLLNESAVAMESWGQRRGHVDLSLLRGSMSENHWQKGKLHAGSIMGRNESKRGVSLSDYQLIWASIPPSIQIQSTVNTRTSAHGVEGHWGLSKFSLIEKIETGLLFLSLFADH